MSRFNAIFAKLRPVQALFRSKCEVFQHHRNQVLLRPPTCYLHSTLTQGGTSLPIAKKNEHDVEMDSKTEEGNLQHPDFYGVKKFVTIKDLFDARVHLGHKEGVRNEFMAPYIFGNRLGVDIFDLEQTLPHLHRALNFIAHVASRQGVILFVSRHLQTIPLVETTAINCGEYAHCRNWMEGTFVNSVTVYGSLIRMPDVLVFMSTHDSVFREHPAVVEAAKLNIPSVGICDTSSDPRLISYPIPGNDDSLQSIQLYCKLFEMAILAGKGKNIVTE